MLHRFQDRGERLVVRLTMGARTLPDARSRNVVAELPGTERPEEVVVLGDTSIPGTWDRAPWMMAEERLPPGKP